MVEDAAGSLNAQGPESTPLSSDDDPHSRELQLAFPLDSGEENNPDEPIASQPYSLGFFAIYPSLFTGIVILIPEPRAWLLF